MSESETKEGALVVLGCLVTVLAIPWWGFTFSTIWRWHAVPFGLPPVSTGAVIGLMVLLSMARYQTPRKDRAEIDYGMSAAMDILAPAFWLWVAWLARFL